MKGGHMRTLVVAVGASVVVFLIAVALAPAQVGAIAFGSNRPAACSNAVDFNANYDCPTPYVELAPPPEGDEVFSRVWQCPATKYAIGMVKREHGNDREACAGAGTTGWVAAERPSPAPPCEITGNVPPVLWPLLCDFATSVHGGEGPVNALTVMVEDADIARAIRSGSPEAENLLLNMLNAWMVQRGVRVAQVDIFYGRAHIATAETHVWRAPSVTFH